MLFNMLNKLYFYHFKKALIYFYRIVKMNYNQFFYTITKNNGKNGKYSDNSYFHSPQKI